MSSWLALIISCIALLVSGLSAWLTFFRKGSLVMTQPTVIYFGPDSSNGRGNKNKIFLRTLLYSTANRGHVIESLYVSLTRNETKQNFNIWVYGETKDLKRGSGLYIPQEGVTYNHHFLLPEDGAEFNFLSGKYKLLVFAKLIGPKSLAKLATVELVIDEAQALQITDPNYGLYFDWGPDKNNYHAHIQKI